MALLAILAGCGGAADSDGEPLSAAQLIVYRDVEACLGLSAEPPRIDYDGTIECPQSHTLCCLESYGYRGEGDGIYGASGKYRDGLVTIPDQCDRALRHEFIHSILDANDRQDSNHETTVWVCQ
jgi:hypothetical protein